MAAGARAFSIKFFGPDAEAADAWSRSPGGFEQAVQGVENLKSIGPVRVEVRAILHHGNLARASEFVSLAARLRADQIHVEFDIDAIGLANLASARQGIRELVDAAKTARMPLDFSTVQAGSVHHRWVNC